MRRKILESERLILSEFHPSEAVGFYKLNLDDSVMQYTGDDAFATISEAREFILNYSAYRIHSFGRWSVYTKKDDQWIGWCGLKHNEDGLIDIGFRLIRSAWNKGYATEAAKSCLEYGFNSLQIEQIIARCSVNNRASQRVLEKLNMTFWKTEEFDNLGLTHYYIKNKT